MALAPSVGSMMGGGGTVSMVGSYGALGRLQRASLAFLHSSKCVRGSKCDGGRRWQAAMAAIVAKGSPFPLIGIMGRPVDLTAATILHSRVRTTTRHMVELQQAHGYGGLGQGGGFPPN